MSPVGARWLMSICYGTAALMAFSPVRAQQLNEIVVTAQKREQSIQSVALSVTAIGGAQLHDLGATTVKDVDQQLPGVIMTATSTGSVTVLPSIRGITQNDYTPHQEPPNAVYIDEAYVSTSAAIGFSLFDLQRVEVLRGPQGTLFGRNATGGAVQFVANKPTKEFAGYGTLHYGSYNDRGYEGAISGPLTDRVQGRIALLTEQHDPWWKNDAPAGTIGGNSNTFAARSLALRGQINFDVTDSVSNLVSVTLAEDRKHGEGTYKAIPGAVNAQGLGYDISPNVNANGTCPGCDYFGYRDPNIERPFESAFASLGYLQKRYTSISNRLTWTSDDWTLTSISNYQRFTFDYREDCDGTPFAVCIYLNNQNLHQLSQELRMTGTSGRLTWTGGLYFLDISQHNTQGYDSNADPNGPLALFAYVAREPYSQSTRSIAAFGQTEYEFHPGWTLVTGLRLSDDRKDFHSATGAPGQAPFYVYNAANGDQTEITKKDWAGKAQVNWQPGTDSLYYAGVTRGNKGPGFNATPFGALPTGYSVTFKSEELTSYEIGSKQTFDDGRAHLNGAIYYYNYSDYQAFNLILLNTVIGNNKAKLYGGELELNIEPVPTWLVSAGLSLENGTVDAIRLPLGQYADRQPPQLPHVTTNGLIRKSWPSSVGKFSAQLDGRYTGSRFASVSNAPTTRLGGAAILNGRIGYSDPSDHWNVALEVTNLANREIVNYVFDVSASYGLNIKSYERPRWFIGEVTYRF